MAEAAQGDDELLVHHVAPPQQAVQLVLRRECCSIGEAARSA